MSITSDFLKTCSQILTSELKQKSSKVMNEAISKKNLTDSSTTCDIEAFINILESSINAVSGKKKSEAICRTLREKVMELDLNNQTKEMRTTICGEPKDLNINDFLARINAENMKPAPSDIKPSENQSEPRSQVPPVSQVSQNPPVPSDSKPVPPASQPEQKVQPVSQVMQDSKQVPPLSPPDKPAPSPAPVSQNPPVPQPSPVIPSSPVPPASPVPENPQDSPIKADIDKFLAKNSLPAESEITRMSAELALKNNLDAETVKKQIIDRAAANFRIELNKKAIKIEIDKFLFGFQKPEKGDIDDFVNYMSLLNLRYNESELREQIETERLLRKFQDPILEVSTSEIDRFISLLKAFTEKNDFIKALNENEMSYLIKNENGVSQMLLFDLIELMALIERDSPAGLYLNQIAGKTPM